jgi:hypothetical protein
MTIPTHLHGLCESGKANLGVSNVEYCVVAPHKGIPQDPVRDVFPLANGAKASFRANIPLTGPEFQGEFSASDAEGNGRESGVTWISPVLSARIARTRDV